MLVSVQCGPFRRIHGPAGVYLSGNRWVRPRPVRPVPKASCRLPFFLCQRRRTPPSASALPRTRLAAAVCASAPHALTPCASVRARPSPARLCAPRAVSAAAPMASALRMCTCTRAVRCRARPFHRAPCASVAVPSALGPRVLFAPCASVAVPSALGPRVLCALRVCDCAVRARPAHPAAARVRTVLHRLTAALPVLVPPSAPALVPHRLAAAPARALLWPPSASRTGLPRPARALRRPPSVLRSACRRPALASRALRVYGCTVCARPAHLVPPPCPRATVASVFTAPAPFAVAPGPRALRVCDCAVCVRPAHPCRRPRLRNCPAPACRGPAARYGGLRLCCAQLPPSASRPLRPCASVTTPSAPAAHPIAAAPRLRPHRLAAPGPRTPRAAARLRLILHQACRGPARALLWPPSLLRPACRRPASRPSRPARL